MKSFTSLIFRKAFEKIKIPYKELILGILKM